MIISPLQAYIHAYKNFPEFPDDWMITQNFSWKEAFTNERREDGVPILEIFKNVAKTAEMMQIIRGRLGKPIIVHCWVRQIPHNIRAGSTAARSPHINGRAVDFHVNGMSDKVLQKKIYNMNLRVRIEKDTIGWTHIDIGNSYTNAMAWGYFTA